MSWWSTIVNIEGKAESHFAKATTALETGCLSPLAALAANHGPDRAPPLATCSGGTYSGGHSSRHVGFASLPLITCPEMSLEQPQRPRVPQGCSCGSWLGAGNGVVSQQNAWSCSNSCQKHYCPWDEKPAGMAGIWVLWTGYRSLLHLLLAILRGAKGPSGVLGCLACCTSRGVIHSRSCSELSAPEQSQAL